MIVTDIILSNSRKKYYDIYIDGEKFVTAPFKVISIFDIKEDCDYECCDLLNFAVCVELYLCNLAALKILTYSARSSKELSIKLTDKGFTQDTIFTIIDVLKLKKYLNDKEYAFFYAKNRVERKLIGRFALKRELINKKFDNYTIDEVIEKIYSEFDQYELAMDAVNKKYNTKIKREKNIKRLNEKIYLFLIGKGFETEIAGDITRKYLKKNEVQGFIIDEE